MNYPAEQDATFSKSKEPALAYALLYLMEQISEDEWAAGWMSGLEFMLWARVKDLSTPPDIKTETLRVLSERAGGWIKWDEKLGCPVFVPLEEWEREAS